MFPNFELKLSHKTLLTKGSGIQMQMLSILDPKPVFLIKSLFLLSKLQGDQKT